jgi:hypothetical protein
LPLRFAYPGGRWLVGDRRSTHLVQLIALLAHERRHPPKPQSYEEHRERMGLRVRQQSTEWRKIAALSAVHDAVRRDLAATNFQFFCTADFAQSFHFDALRFTEYAAIFWPDYACWTLKADVWTIFGMDWMAPRAQHEVAFEPGQFMVDKTRCWRELRVALWFAEHSDFVFRVVYGDKECFPPTRRTPGTH